jgi:hypothetical protein
VYRVVRARELLADGDGQLAGEWESRVFLEELMELLEHFVNGGAAEEFRFFALACLFKEVIISPEQRLEASSKTGF